MKVLWVGHFVPYPPRGGAPQRSFNLVREAAKRVELHFVGTSLRGHQPAPEDSLAALEAMGRVCETVRLRRIAFRTSTAGKALAALEALATRRSYNETWLASSSTRRLVEEAVRRVQPDVVHVDSVMVAELIPKSYAGPAVLNHHNVESHMMARRSDGESGLLARFMKREALLLRNLETRTAPRFDRHLVVSSLDEQRLRGIVPTAHTEVVPNGVDVAFFRPIGGAESPKTLVFSGRMNWYPNENAMVRFLEELWPSVRRRVPGARMIVAGMNPTSKLRAAAERFSDVEVTGFVDDMRPVIDSAAVYVCPILDGGGTRLKLLDAMAMGKPIVATPMAAEGLAVRDGEEMVLRDFGEPLVDAIAELLSNEVRRREMGARARTRVVSDYDWAAIGARLVRIYRNVAEAGGGAG